MRKNIVSIVAFFLMINLGFSQYTCEGVVVDKVTKQPIEMVDVHNQKDYTSTNKQGQFYFSSKLDSITFRILGFEEFKTTFKEFPKNDTVFLTSKFVELDEVVLDKNYKLKQLNKAVKTLYPKKPYEESFFLRAVLKQDGKIIKIEDLVGKVKRKALFTDVEGKVPKKNYKVEIKQIRKVGIEEKGWGSVDFTMHSFNELFHLMASVFASSKAYKYKEIPLQDNNFEKLSFEPKNPKKEHLKGYYILNSKDNALIEAMLQNTFKDREFTKKRGIKYRTTFFKKRVNFKKSNISHKYFIDKARIDEAIEVFEKEGKRRVYEITYVLKTQDNFNKHNVDSNVSVKKEIFSLKGRYNANFWTTQNYLKLTDEMRNFINELNTKESKSYRRVSNIK